MTAMTFTALLAADPALPWRDALVDPIHVIAHYASLAGIAPERISRCSVRRAKYRVGGSLRVTYDMTIDDLPQIISTRAYDRCKPVTTPAPGAGEACTMRDVRYNALWRTFPADRYVRDLPFVLDPPTDWPLARALGWCCSDVAEYRAEHSTTLRCIGPEGATIGFAKVFRPGDASTFPLTYQRLNAIVDDDTTTIGSLAQKFRLRVPRVLAVSHQPNVFVLEAVPGGAWDDAEREHFQTVLTQLGSVLAVLHSVPLEPFTHLPAFRRLDEERLRESLHLIAAARPDVASLTTALEPRLARRPVASTPSVLHGDVHPKNALFDGSSLSLIDFDQAGIGSPAADIASLVGVIRQLEYTKDLDRPIIDALEESLFTGYEKVRPLPPDAELRWSIAAALVAERSLRAVNRLQRVGLANLERNLTDALDTLKGTRR